MADALKLLVTEGAGSRTPAAATLTKIYDVPDAASAMLSRIIICNTSAVPTAFRIAIIEPAGSIALDHYIAYDVPIAGNETINFAIGAGMAADTQVWVYNTLATLTFTPCGIEVT